MDNVRIAVDVGGTFTDIALEHAEGMTTKKVLTTPDKPEEGVLSGIQSTLTEANISPSEIKILIHGTCLLYTSPSPRDLVISRMPSSA